MPERVRIGSVPGPILRHEVGSLIRDRTPVLLARLASDLSARYPEFLSSEAANAAAGLILTLLSSAIEAGDLSPRAGAVHDLERLCHGLLGTRNMFHAVDQACAMIGDELSSRPRLGAASPSSSGALALVRHAAFDVLAAFTARLLDTPAHGSVRDPLTTLVARPVFDLALQQEAQRALRHQGSFAVILFDVDDLSLINRAHGYGVGDRVLERLGILARRFFRTHDWVARHDEDSLAVLLPETSLEQAAELATRFRDTVQQRLVLLDDQTEARDAVRVSAVALAAEGVRSELSAADMLARAEAAVAAAKVDPARQTARIAL